MQVRKHVKFSPPDDETLIVAEKTESLYKQKLRESEKRPFQAIAVILCRSRRPRRDFSTAKRNVI